MALYRKTLIGVLHTRLRKEGEMLSPLKPRAERAHREAAKWSQKAKALDKRIHEHEETMAGLRGLIQHEEHGATYFIETDNGILFYNDEHERVRLPKGGL